MFQDLHLDVPQQTGKPDNTFHLMFDSIQKFLAATSFDVSGIFAPMINHRLLVHLCSGAGPRGTHGKQEESERERDCTAYRSAKGCYPNIAAQEEAHDRR